MADNLNISVPVISLGAAAANQIVSLGPVPYGAKVMSAQLIFTYGSGGTAANFYLQSSVDGGVTWFDIANFSQTTASANKMATILANVSSNPAVITDGAITANTVASLLGDRIRIKWTSTGTYVASTAKFDIRYAQ